VVERGLKTTDCADGVCGAKKMRLVNSLCVALCVSVCYAIPRELLYPHGVGTDQVLPEDQDEAASPEITLKVPIVFYGETYSSIYVSSYTPLCFTVVT
jgi:hypothetical protein